MLGSDGSPYFVATDSTTATPRLAPPAPLVRHCVPHSDRPSRNAHRFAPERVKAPLIEMAHPCRKILSMPPLCMGEGQPPHKLGQIAISPRPLDSMPMIRHHTIRQCSHRHSLMGLFQHALKGVITSSRLKNALPAIPPGSTHDRGCRPAAVGKGRPIGGNSYEDFLKF